MLKTDIGPELEAIKVNNEVAVIYPSKTHISCHNRSLIIRRINFRFDSQMIPSRRIHPRRCIMKVSDSRTIVPFPLTD
jgi:hypothetical protein